MTRNGKIARLPHGIREKLNCKLRDNVPGTKICDWVNRLPACRRVCADFARRSGKSKSPVTVNHLSEWRRGGFQDWLREQAVLEESRELRQWCGKLARDGGDITEGVATLLSGQLLKVVQGIGNIQVPMKSDPKLQASKRPSSRETPNFKSEGLNPKSERNPNDEIRISSSSQSLHASEDSESRLKEELLRVADPRSGEVERLESAVGLLGALVKCLAGIRRGDHNRVRLAQSEKKLALRSQLVAMELEIYGKEKAKQEELERQERAAERRRKQSQLSERGKMDLLRGNLFGPDLVVIERERELEKRDKETMRLRKELEILKEKMPKSRHSADGTEDDSAESNVHPPSQSYDSTSVPSSNVDSASGDESNVQGPKSNIASASGNEVPSSSKSQGAGARPSSDQGSSKLQVPSSNVDSGAASARESARVDTSACDQLQGKNVEEENGRLKIEDGGVHGAEESECGMRSAECGMTGAEDRSCKDAANDFDPVEAKRELERIRKGLAALAAGEQVEFDPVAAERDLERIAKELKVALAKQEATRVI